MRSIHAEKHGTKVWGGFKEIYDTIDSGAKKIAIRSANGLGKTHFLGTLAGFEAEQAIETGVPVKIIVTSANATQLNQGLWPRIKSEVKKVAPQAKRVHKLIEHELFKVIGVNPAKVESGQGYHAERVVVFVDEAAAFSMEMLNALFSNATGSNSLIVVTFNPTNSDCALADIEESDKTWKFFELSAFDHPNVINGSDEIEGAVTREFVDSILNMSSVPCTPEVDNAIFVPWNNTFWQPTREALARVCGKYSLQVSYGFIPMSEALQACKAEVKHGMRTIGVDVATTGEDSTVLTVFDGEEQLEFRSIKTSEFSIIAKWIISTCEELNVTLVTIDDTGIGSAVSERLREMNLKALLIPVHFSQKAKGFDKLRNPNNARAEMYFCLEQEIRAKKIKLLYDTQFLKELCAVRFVQSKSQELSLRLEDKALVKRRLGRSPDKADATALCRYGIRLLKFYNQPRLL